MLKALAFWSVWLLTSTSASHVLGRRSEQLRIPAAWSTPQLAHPSAVLPDSAPLVGPALQNFQTHEPAPILTTDSHSCTIVLVHRSFTNSYGRPSTVHYSPSAFKDSLCSSPSAWTGLTLSIHGSSQGRQFDRLGTIWIGNNNTGQGVNVWTHDNPEPTKIGVYWDISKDVGKYYSLFRNDADVVFDLPNIVDDTYTGALNMTLSLTAHVPRQNHSAELPSYTPLSLRAPNVVLPVSTHQRNAPSSFVLGGSAGNGTSLVQIPRNTARAVVEIAASGTATEEFWYTGLPDKFYAQIPNGASEGYYGHGPYREIQLYIDGVFAGFATPYPVIYTGGINPLLWRPSVNYGTFDQPTYSIDVTPFVGLLTDDQPHNFTLSVVSSERNGTINDASWYVSGSVQVYLDSSASRTTGRLLHTHGSVHASGRTNGKMRNGDPLANGSLTYSVQLQSPRLFYSAGTVTTGSGSSYIAAWSQMSSYSNHGFVNATVQRNNQTSYGWTRSMAMPTSASGSISEIATAALDDLALSEPKVRFVQLDFSYPLYSDSSLTNVSFDAHVKQDFHRTVKTSSVSELAVDRMIGNEETLTQVDAVAVPNRFLFSHKDAHAHSVLSNGTLSNGTGTSWQTFLYRDMQGNTIDRSILTNTTDVVSDVLKGSIAYRAQPGQL